MKNLKISMKLALCFGLVGVICIASNVIAFFSMSKLHTVDVQMYRNNTGPLVKLGIMYDTLATQRICVSNMVLFIDEEEIVTGETESLKEKEELFESSLEFVKQYAFTSKEATIYKEMEPLYFNDFNQLKTELKDAVAKKDIPKAHDILKQIDSMGSDISNFLDEAMALNDSLAKEKMTNNETLFKNRTLVGAVSTGLNILFAILLAMWLTSLINKPVKIIEKIANSIAHDGDLTTTMPSELLQQKDELGSLANSIQTMQNSMRSIVKNILNESYTLKDIIVESNNNLDSLSGAINTATDSLKIIFAETQQTSASAEEMNATSYDIESNVTNMSNSAQNGSTFAKEISVRADNLKTSFSKAQHNALSMFASIKKDLEQALEDAKAVEQIDLLTEAILQISSQTDLLSLNASIEAAKAGEYGRGFAIVASEIKSLAETSEQTVEKIQKTTRLVSSSVENLAKNSKLLLSFMSTDVSKDYDTMLIAADTYSNDANQVYSITNAISSTAETLLTSISDMTTAITEVTEAATETSNNITTLSEQNEQIINTRDYVVENLAAVTKSESYLLSQVQQFKV